MESLWAMWAVLVSGLALLKRLSLFRPGGFLKARNEEMASRAFARRRRRVRDLLDDPVLVKDLERRLRDVLGGAEAARAEILRLREAYPTDTAESATDSHDSGKAKRREYPVLAVMNCFLAFALVSSHFVSGHIAEVEICTGVWIFILGLLALVADYAVIIRGSNGKKSRVKTKEGAPSAQGTSIKESLGKNRTSPCWQAKAKINKTCLSKKTWTSIKESLGKNQTSPCWQAKAKINKTRLSKKTWWQALVKTIRTRLLFKTWWQAKMKIIKTHLLEKTCRQAKKKIIKTRLPKKMGKESKSVFQ